MAKLSGRCTDFPYIPYHNIITLFHVFDHILIFQLMTHSDDTLKIFRDMETNLQYIREAYVCVCVYVFVCIPI